MLLNRDGGGGEEREEEEKVVERRKRRFRGASTTDRRFHNFSIDIPRFGSVRRKARRALRRRRRCPPSSFFSLASSTLVLISVSVLLDAADDELCSLNDFTLGMACPSRAIRFTGFLSSLSPMAVAFILIESNPSFARLHDRLDRLAYLVDEAVRVHHGNGHPNLHKLVDFELSTY